MAVLSATLFSVATSSLAHNPPWDFRMLTDPTAAAAFRGLGLKACRINALVCLTDIFGGDLQGQPNWAIVEALVVGYPQALPGARLTLCLLAHWSVNYADATMRQRAADRYVQVAQYLKSRGLRVDRWEVINEPDFTPSPADTADTERRVRTALHAAGFTEPVGGPCTSWARNDYFDPSIAAGAEFVDWHTYVKAPGDAVSTDQLFDRALSVGGGGKGPHPWVLTEYGIDSWNNPAVQPDPRQQTIEGAVFVALVGISCATKGVESTYLWRLENDDGSYGVFHTNTWNLNPAGAIIQAANKFLIPGAITPFTGPGPRTAFLQSDGGAGRSLLAVNYATSGNPVTVAVPAGMGLRYFQNPANPHGASGGGAPVASIALPPMGIAILSTAIVAMPDDPDGTIVGPGKMLHANGHNWLINPAGVIEVDGAPDATTASVVWLQFAKPLVVQTNASGGKWSKMVPPDPWTPYTAPPIPPPDTGTAAKAAMWDALVTALRPLLRAISAG